MPLLMQNPNKTPCPKCQGKPKGFCSACGAVAS